MIKKETILSNYDNKLTLLQWLKQVQGQLKDLKENGVPANTPVYTAKEFDEKYKNANGEYVNCIFVLDGTYTETIYLNGQLYAGDNVPSWVGNGLNYFIFGTYADYIYWKEDGFGEGSLHNCYTWTFNDTFTEMLDEDEYASGGKFFMKPDVDNAIDEKIRTDVYDYTNWGGLYKGLLDRNNLNKFVHQQKKTCYGICGADVLSRDMAIGIFKDNPNLFVYNFNGILIRKDGEIYYSTGEGTLNTQSDEIENAISGTQLKEAVRLATQKTYWHTIRLHNSGTLSDVNITIVIPSHSNNPVARVEDLLAIGAGDTWGCSGTIATTESALPIVTFDAVKFGATADATIFSGTLGRTYTLTQLIAKSLEYDDNVKEVK